MNAVQNARMNAARILADRNGTDPMTAYRLICRIARYALADAHQWERDNTQALYDSAQSAEAERRLNARRARLDKELNAYGCRLHNFGLYPSIVECGNEGREVCTIAYY